MSKTYTARTITGAQARVRQLEKIIDNMEQLLRRYKTERMQLAKLAAEGPAFYNPLEVYDAKKVRDLILERECNLKPNGSPF